MGKRRVVIVVLILVTLFTTMSCSMSNLGNPFAADTETPTPTVTLTHTPTLTLMPTKTPIPGIEAPIVYGKMNLKVVKAYFSDEFTVVVDKVPTRYVPNPGYTFLIVMFNYYGAGPADVTNPDNTWTFSCSVKSLADYFQYDWQYNRWDPTSVTTGNMYMLFVPKEGKTKFSLVVEGTEVPLERFFQ